MYDMLPLDLAVSTNFGTIIKNYGSNNSIDQPPRSILTNYIMPCRIVGGELPNKSKDPGTKIGALIPIAYHFTI